MTWSRSALAAALEARAKQGATAAFTPEELCFGPQRCAVQTAAKRVVLRCGRRSGKSQGQAIKLLSSVTAPPFTNVFYLTLTLKNAKRIIWSDLKRLNRDYNLGGVANETEGYLAFPALGDDVHLYLGGLKDPGEAEKIRGVRCKFYDIDEAQAIPQRILAPTLKDIIRPALLDYGSGGELWMCGTPGPLLSGPFYEVDQGELRGGWEHHHWTVRENERLPARMAGESIEEILANVLRENAWEADNPTYRREWLGEWIQDAEVLVFKYDRTRNAFDQREPGEWQHVIGVDLGFEDADAIAVLGWRKNDPNVYLVHEQVDRKADVTALAERVRAAVQQWKPQRVVWDFGGLGKKIAEEMQRRHGLPVEPADKARKLEHIELLNDALLTGRFKARPNGPFAEDCALVQWDQDARAKGLRKVAEDYHSDITDAVLYAYRACMGFLQKPAAPARTYEQTFVDRLYQQQQRERAVDPIDAALARFGR